MGIYIYIMRIYDGGYDGEILPTIHGGYGGISIYTNTRGYNREINGISNQLL